MREFHALGGDMEQDMCGSRMTSLSRTLEPLERLTSIRYSLIEEEVQPS